MGYVCTDASLRAVRPHLVYSDGQPVRASDFKRAIERLFIVGSPAAAYFTFSHLIGAPPCINRLSAILYPITPKPQPSAYPACNLSNAITAHDRLGQVTFHLSSPDPAFLDELAEPYADPVPPGTPNQDVGTTPIPGTGPYEISKYVKRHLLVLTRNPRFHVWSRQAQPPGLPDRIVIRGYRSAAAEFRAVENGKADISWDSTGTGVPTPASIVRPLEVRFPNQLKATPFPAIHFLVLDTTKEPLRDPLVRRAISDAIDRRQAVAYFNGPNQAIVTCQYLPVDFPAYHPHCPSTLTPSAAGIYNGPDLITAQRLIRKAGMTGAKVTFLDFNNGDLTHSYGRDITVTLRSIGLNATNQTDPNAHPHGATIYLTGWLEDFPLASDFIAPLFACGASNNGEGYCSPTIDRQINRASTVQQTDPGAADRLWQGIEQSLLKDPPLIPLIQQQWVNLLGPHVGNYQLHLLLGPLLDQMWVR